MSLTRSLISHGLREKMKHMPMANTRAALLPLRPASLPMIGRFQLIITAIIMGSCYTCLVYMPVTGPTHSASAPMCAQLQERLTMLEAVTDEEE